MLFRVFIALIALTACLATDARAAKATAELKSGSVRLKSIGPLAFGPDGVLLVSDPADAAIYAIATGDTTGDPSLVKLNVENIGAKVASLLGAEPQDVQIVDIAVNPLSGNGYLAVSRGSGPEAEAVLLRVNAQGEISDLSLKNVRHAKAQLPNPPESRQTRRGDPRMLTITDMAYLDGRVFIAGLSNEEFASKLRAIPYPFQTADDGTSVEIFHGAHGRIETRSPIMTFAPYEIGSEPHVLAAYTCTPLVKFRVADLKPGTKVRGTTVAELGNRNRPLDMFIYQKNGQDYILMANSSRGVMRIPTHDVGQAEAITDPVEGGGTAGLPYETIESLQGVAQLDRLNESYAVALFSKEDGTQDLRTIELP